MSETFGFELLSKDDLSRYTALKTRHSRRQFLDAIEAEKRTLEIKLISSELLRKGANRTQRNRMDVLSSDLRASVHEQMSQLNRRSFRSPVSVEIDLYASALPNAPSSPPTVKAYLDILQGLVYDDDSKGHHLRVARHARDNPILRVAPEDWIYLSDRRRPNMGPSSGVAVRIRVMPIRLYKADYDRAFKLRKQVFGADEFSVQEDEGHPFWTSGWQVNSDDDRLDELREERRDDLEDRPPLYGEGGLYDSEEMRQFRVQERRRRDVEIRELRHRLLLDQRPQDYDRPGALDELDELLWEGMGPVAEIVRDRDVVMAGSFFLPLPPEVGDKVKWAIAVGEAMERHKERFPIMGSEPLEKSLALDISVRGAGSNQRDLDNLARDVLVQFEQIYCANNRGTVVSYRVYQSLGVRDEVRVLVMTDERLHQLEDAISKARNWILLNGPQDD